MLAVRTHVIDGSPDGQNYPRLSVVQSCAVTAVCNVGMIVELIFFSQIHVVLVSIDQVVILSP